MHYLNAAAYECMGLLMFPPVQFDLKFALADDILPEGKFVRKGTRLHIRKFNISVSDPNQAPWSAQILRPP